MLKEKILLIAFHIYVLFLYSTAILKLIFLQVRGLAIHKKNHHHGGRQTGQVVGWFNKCKPDFFYFLLRLVYLPICSPVDGRQALQGTISQLAGSVGLHSPYALFFGHLLLSSLLMLCSSCSMDRPVTK